MNLLPLGIWDLKNYPEITQMQCLMPSSVMKPKQSQTIVYSDCRFTHEWAKTQLFRILLKTATESRSHHTN